MNENIETSIMEDSKNIIRLLRGVSTEETSRGDFLLQMVQSHLRAWYSTGRLEGFELSMGKI